MKAYWYILLIVGALVAVSCDGKHKSKATQVVPNKEVPVNTRYSGQHEGCIVHYNDLFCPPRYKDGVLNAGEVLYIRDKNGSIIVLDKNVTSQPTKVYIKMEGDV